MARPRSRVPTLKRDKSGSAYVLHASIPNASHRLRLGKYGEPETEKRYRDFLEALQATTPVPAVTTYVAGGRETVLELAQLWDQWAETHYSRGGKIALERNNMRHAIREMVEVCGDTVAATFGPRRLLQVRDAMARSGRLSRSTVNSRLSKIKRFWKWACSRELVPKELWTSLGSVSGLAVGEMGVAETSAVTPVSMADLKAAIKHAPPVVADMLRVQFQCVMRPGEVCEMHEAGISKQDGPWLYVPASHKTTWRGKRLVKAIPAKARAIIKRRLGKPTGFLFSTAEARVWGREQAAKTRGPRKTKVYPCELERREAAQGGDVDATYKVNSYRTAVARACVKAGIEPFSPNQVRHAAVTWVSDTLPAHDAAQLLAGHAHAATTDIYRDATAKRLSELASMVDGEASPIG